jgi:CheY-like chemotaxis protein
MNLAAPGTVSARGPFRVLVADDDADTVLSLQMVLAAQGYDVWPAADGPTAKRVAAVAQPHAALLDLAMPGCDGCEVAREIRAAPWGLGCLLVAVTGWGRADDHVRTRAAGFHAHFLKPADPKVLTALVADWVNRGRPELDRPTGA